MKIQSFNNNIYFSARVKYPLLPKNELLLKVQQGLTYDEIAGFYNVPKHVVERSLKTYSIEARKIKNAQRRINTINLKFLKIS
ncbi:hypothetical protein J6N69_00025 [bacterium]|nr:hypothetical protein [bacterium]MBP3846192.1 hypothetical protein [bacterium]